ncbi:MAG: SurA N-terminal domain-containing protein [Candidatus Cloacimonetes bacterium]|nr:SurA N-terminal domain-containing protein [Candidatus Cloacimonadota bacterium]
MKRNQILLIVTITTIILAIVNSGCSRRPSNYIGMVNNRPITYEEYMIAQRYQFENYVVTTGFTPDTVTREQLSNQAFNNIVERNIFEEKLRKFNITVSYSEVIDTLTTNIPAVIINSGLFTEDGIFNHEKYRESLLTNNPVDLSILVRDYAETYVPRVKLKEKVIANYHIPEQEIRDEYLALNSSADASIICLYPSHFENVVIYDREIRDYYNENRFDYLTEPYAQIKYVIFPLKPSALDSLATKTKIDSIYTELMDDVPFPILAGNLSDSQTSVNRGEMPFMELEHFPVRIRNDLERLRLEEFTRPFAVTDGWVIYQLMARTRNMVKLREIFIKHRPSQRTRELLYNRIVNIRELATELGLENTAYEYDLDIYTTDIVKPEDPFIPYLGKSDGLIERAINARPGAIFEPISHNQLQAFVLVEVVDNQSRDFLPLQVVYDDIQVLLQKKRQFELAKQTAASYQRRFGYNRIIEEAEKEGFPVLHFDNFSINTYFPEIDPIHLTRAMFPSGRNRTVAQPVVGENGVYLGIVHRLDAADTDYLTTAVRSLIRERIIKNRGDELFNEWFQEQKANAKVHDWRNRLR